ncbi:hypothetical protein ACROYT_G002040 [Oculina patagonica]
MATALEVYRRRCVAQERKKIHESSEYIYPMREKNNSKPAPRKTSYSVDFAKKEGKPAKPRPCSVTRRNRPHPSQNFLNWRIPSKPMPGQKSNETINALLNLSDLETKARFYDDYVGKFNSKKCNHFQNIGNPAPRYTTRPRYLKRAEFEGNTNEEETPGSLPICIIPPLCMSKDAGQRYDTLVARNSSRERVIIESCLDAGDRGYLGKSLENAIQAEAIPAIHRWLKSQSESDRNIALGFLSNLSKSTSLNQDQALNRKSADISKAARDVIVDQVRQMMPKDVRTRERRRPAKYSPPRGRKLRLPPKPPPRAFVMNKGALFMQPHRCLPGHFEIHPEFQISAKRITVS